MGLRHMIVFTCISYVCGQWSKGFEFIENIYDQCSSQEDSIKCLKIQALKIADRAVQSKQFGIFDGVSIVRDENDPKSFSYMPENNIDQLQSNQLDQLIANAIKRFLETHRLNVKMSSFLEEGRGKKKEKYSGPFMAALAIKGMFMLAAYKGIAMMSGAALLIGKISLILTALLGLKKLVGGGSEKTTFEIVKHPHISQSHSVSHDDIDDGHYRRSMIYPNDPNLIHQKVYNGYVPQN